MAGRGAAAGRAAERQAEGPKGFLKTSQEWQWDRQEVWGSRKRSPSKKPKARLQRPQGGRCGAQAAR